MSELRNRNELKQFQQDFYNNIDQQREYVNAENTDSDSESDNEEQLRITRLKSHKKGRMDDLVISYMINQQKEVRKVEKKMAELQRQLDKEEIESRYLKLDLNNSQVERDNALDILNQTKQTLLKTRLVLLLVIVLNFLYLFW